MTQEQTSFCPCCAYREETQDKTYYFAQQLATPSADDIGMADEIETMQEYLEAILKTIECSNIMSEDPAAGGKLVMLSVDLSQEIQRRSAVFYRAAEIWQKRAEAVGNCGAVSERARTQEDVDAEHLF